MKFQQKNLTDLQKRLRSVLPEYKPISEFNGESGTYKAVNNDGNVFLVTWTCEEGKTPVRSESMIMDFNGLMNKSEGYKRPAPDEAWNLTE